MDSAQDEPAKNPLNESDENYEDEFEENVASPPADQINKLKKLAENYEVEISKNEGEVI